jgi:hypothetical protein
MMINENTALKDVIVEYLRKKHESISGVSKKLEEDGLKHNRLIIAGYLKALADVGLVKETEVKPAKVYSPGQACKKTIYEAVGDEIKKCKLGSSEEVVLAVHCLERLFSRAIFMDEIRRCGLDPKSIDTKKADRGERAKARTRLAKCKIKLPFNDPAYLPNLPKPGQDYSELSDAILIQAFLRAYDAEDLRVKNKKD